MVHRNARFRWAFLLISCLILESSRTAEAQGLRKVHAAIPSISPTSIVFVIARELARFLKNKEDLAGRLYDLILPGTTRDGTISEALQKRSIENIIERVGVKEAPPLDRMYNFSVARKIRDELLAKGWKP
jgi:hypothetical protein